MSDQHAVETRATPDGDRANSGHGGAAGLRGDDRWLRRAACHGADLNLFFPEARQSPSEQAKAYCAACSVSTECLEYAIEHRLSGVWGGTSETQRSRLRRMRRAS